MNARLRQIKRTNHINESECFSLAREVDIYPSLTSLVISSLLRTEQNSPVLKAPSPFRCKVARNVIRSTPNNTRKSNMSPGDVYLPHKRREKLTLFYIVQWRLDVTKTLRLAVICRGCYTRQILSLSTTDRNTYESRRVNTSWLL